MFEGSLVESRRLVGTGTERWTALGSLTIQCAVAGLLIAIPLLRPQVLPIPKDAPPLSLPFLHKAPVPVQTRAVTATSTAMSLPSAGPAPMAMGPTIWPHPGQFTDATAPMVNTNLSMGTGGSGLPIGLGVGTSNQPVVAVMRTKEPGLPNISTGVMAGMLIAPIEPVYPAIAKAVRVQGAVVIEAVISKTGRIESAHAVSGPAMLERAALDAVAAARYRPYLLNGQPTEVKTTITVVFSLGS